MNQTSEGHLLFEGHTPVKNMGKYKHDRMGEDLKLLH